MRVAGLFAAMVLAAPHVVTAAAGQVAEGPLKEPAAVDAPAQPGSKVAHKTRKRAGKAGARPVASADRATASAASSLPAAASAATPAPRRAAAAPADDPISLGFKWQGNNDTAEKTRVQNYNGDASGTGAAVGLKLHF